MVNSRRLMRGPSTALSLDRDFDLAEKISLESDTRHVIPREGSSLQRRFFSLQNYRFRRHASPVNIN